MEDHIKCELMGGGSPRHLNTFSNLFIVAVHYTHQYMLCIVAVHYTYTNTHYVLLLCTTHTSIHALYCCYF